MAAREVVLVALRVFGHLGLLLAWLGRLVMLLVLVFLVLLVVTLAAGMLASSIQLGQRSAEEATSPELHFAAVVLAVGARHVWVAWHMAPSWVAWMAQRTRGESADPAAVVPCCAFAAAASAAAASAAAASAAAAAAAAAWPAVPPWPAVPSQQPAL